MLRTSSGSSKRLRRKGLALFKQLQTPQPRPRSAEIRTRRSSKPWGWTCRIEFSEPLLFLWRPVPRGTLLQALLFAQ